MPSRAALRSFSAFDIRGLLCHDENGLSTLPQYHRQARSFAFHRNRNAHSRTIVTPPSAVRRSSSARNPSRPLGVRFDRRRPGNMENA